MSKPRLKLSNTIRHRAVGDEGVLVHLDQGRVIVVNEVGLHIVEALAEPRTREELVRSVTNAFDVTPGQAADDIDHYLAELEQEQVLEHLD